MRRVLGGPASRGELVSLERTLTRRQVLRGGALLGSGILVVACGATTPTRSPQASALARATAAAAASVPPSTPPAPVLSANLLRTALGDLPSGGTVALPGGTSAPYADLAVAAAAFAAAESANPDPVTDPIASLGFALACADWSGRSGLVDLSTTLPKLGIPIVRLELPKLPGSDLTDVLPQAAPAGFLLRPGATLLATSLLPDGRYVLGIADPARTAAGHPRLELAILSPTTAGPLLEAAGATLDASGAIALPGRAPVVLASVDPALVARLVTAAGALFVDQVPLQLKGAKPTLTADPVVPVPDTSLSAVSTQQAPDGRLLALTAKRTDVARARYRPWIPDWEWVTDSYEVGGYTIRELADALGIEVSSPFPNYQADFAGLVDTTINRADLWSELDHATVFRSFGASDWRHVLARWNAVAADLARGVVPDGFPYAWSGADDSLAFARSHGLKNPRSSPLFWTHCDLDSVRNGRWSNSELRKLLEFMVKVRVVRYRDQIEDWGGASEVSANLLWGTPEQQFWCARLGTEIVDEVFRWAHEANPKATLSFQEDRVIDTDLDPRLEAMYMDFLRHFRAAGVPVDQAMLEANLWVYAPPAKGRVLALLRQIQALGYGIGAANLAVVVTPYDYGDRGRARLVASVPDVWQAQAAIYKDVVSAYLAIGAPIGLGGLTDRYEWFDERGPGSDAMLFDTNLRPKPAYFAVRDVLKAELRKRGWSG